MASKYPRANSPYWWIKYKTPEGDYRCVSSGLRRDNVKETHSADRLVEKYEREEKKVQRQRRPAGFRLCRMGARFHRNQLQPARNSQDL